MIWHKNLYVGEEAEKQRTKLIKQLDRQKLVFGAYVITLASNQKDLLDVIPAFMLFREQNAKRQVIGLALTKDEAFSLCEKILMDVYHKTGGFDVRSFFS